MAATKITKEEYGLRLIPDFDIFNVAERELIKQHSFAHYLKPGNNVMAQISQNDFSYIMAIFNNVVNPIERGIELPSGWYRVALRSTRELIIDEKFETNNTIIKVKNPSDKTSNYFYYIIIADTDYVEREETNMTVSIKYDSGDDLKDEDITEIVGVLI